MSTDGQNLEARLVEAVQDVIDCSSGMAREVVEAFRLTIKADGLVLVGVEDLRDAEATLRANGDGIHYIFEAVLAAFDADTEQPEAK